MKKTIRKLVVHRETLRTLRTLDDRDLIHAVGGSEDPLRETGRICTIAAVVGSRDICPA